MKQGGIAQLIWRTGLFFTAAWMLFQGTDAATILKSTDLFGEWTAVHAIWLVLICDMLCEFIPRPHGNIGNNKQFQRYYRLTPHGYDPQDLAAATQKMNRAAAAVLALWCALNVILAVLFFTGRVSQNGILLVVLCYYMCDAFCMFVWCPLQQLFMRSRCCADCRIYGWGYFLVYAPLIFAPSPFTISLLVLSIVLLVRWEGVYKRHPERFWRGSNAELHCRNCRNLSCHVKQTISKRKLAAGEAVQMKVRSGSAYAGDDVH